MTATIPTGGPGAPTPAGDDNRDAIIKAMSRTPEHGRHRPRVVTIAVLSVLIVLYAAVPYLLLDPAVAQEKIGLRPGVPFHFAFLVVHALTGGIALLFGPWQFVRRIRRIPRVHRYIGRIFLFAGVIPASLSGMVVAWLSMAGPVASLGFALLDIAWFTTAWAGYRAARTRRYRDHERWMIRAFALTFAAVTLRLWLVTLILVQLPILDSHYHGNFHDLFDTAYAFVPWLCWIPNLLLTEAYLRRRHRRPAHPAPGLPATAT